MTGSLFDRMLTLKHLRQSWRKVRANHGMPGPDGVTVAQFAEHLDANLRALAAEVQRGSYRPGGLQPAQILTRGKVRALGVPPVRDRVLQRAALDVLAPVCDPRFAPCSFGYRPGRGVRDAVAEIIRLRDEGKVAVVDADIADCFGQLDHELLRQFVRAFVPDRRICDLLDRWIAIAMATPGNAGMARTRRGITLGSIVSPFLCNVYLHQLDLALLHRQFALVRYADDFVILCPNRKQAARSLAVTAELLQDLNLTLNERKTRLTSFDAGFDFLGVRFQRRGFTYLSLPPWPLGDAAAGDLPREVAAPARRPWLQRPFRREP
jgi:CRISPR-associated protein Cas1